MTARRWSKAMVPLGLAVICAALGAKVYDEWRALEEPVAIAAPAAAAGDTPAPLPLGPGLTTPGEDSFAVIIERPLFSPSRRPAEAAPAAAPEAVEAVAPVEVPLDFALVGTVVSGDERVALVTTLADGKIVQVRERGEVLGWTALLIEDGRAVFRRGKAEEELVLRYEDPVPSDKIPAPRPKPAKPAEPAGQPEEGAPADGDVQPPVAAPDAAAPPD
jgi:general secretion pathway protein N